MAAEKDEICWELAGLCRELGVKHLLQVGAEDGYEANFAANITGCSATAIEARSEAKGCSPDLAFYNQVIGASTHSGHFCVMSDGALSSSFNRGGSVVEASYQRLDEFCKERSIKPDALIIDTEGSTLDVLEGCGDLLDEVKFVYAECQTKETYPGVRTVDQVARFMEEREFEQREGHPAYMAGNQGNYLWVKKCES